ncbi:Nuclease-related domain protein [Legionella birminghamensis]|uniref:Nuclease-related domain n=1 Tax=Legionella birminghamensis TaxID=28083 RepID=A0A378JR35_9GAMM|nr:nuclease-related domain-containing protein [Legionella birminghamensis]KTC69000.1 Nuclease-related domain protein [Legionella birminghamensis]STX61004.1 Nuclease-related domain [Legionella birminghamensis]
MGLLEVGCVVDVDIFIFLSVFFIGLVVGYAAGRNRKHNAENCGEARVRHRLTQYCQNKEAHVLSNITLRLEDGSTTQIDHILITPKGIFVIETKHYKGWIFAKENARSWSQSLYYDKFRFQNPLRQNYKHVKAIQKALDFIEPHHVHNIVVFSGKAVFKSAKPPNVFYIDELVPAIEQFTDGALSLNRVQFCVGRLEYMRLAITKKTDVEHQAHLSKRFGDSWNGRV